MRSEYSIFAVVPVNSASCETLHGSTTGRIEANSSDLVDDSGTDRLIRLDVNGRVHRLDIPADTPLLTALRNDLMLNGPKFGCGLGECGSCAVLIDGACVRACVIPVGNVIDRSIVTLEGLGTADDLHPIQHAFIEAQAAQCGYCLNGMIMATKALLDRNPDPTENDIRQALKHQLCRCGTHLEILAAVRLAARSVRSASL